MKRLGTKVLTFSCAGLIAIWLLFCLRAMWVGTPDLVHCGKGNSFWCYFIISPWDISASITVYDHAVLAARGIGTSSSDWFYYHIRALGGTWSVDYSTPSDKYIVHHFGFFGWSTFYRGGVQVEREYAIQPSYLPLIIVMFAGTTLFVQICRWRQRNRPGFDLSLAGKRS